MDGEIEPVAGVSEIKSIEELFGGDLSATGGLTPGQQANADAVEERIFGEPDPTPPTPEMAQWIKDHAVPLDTPVDVSGDKPLPPWQNMTSTYKETSKESVVSRMSELIAAKKFQPPLTAPREPTERDQFCGLKPTTYEGGPFDGKTCHYQTFGDAEGCIYFFRNNGYGKIEQCVYRIELHEVERTEGERRAGKAQEWRWVAKYVGRRFCPQRMVNGIFTKG